MGVYSWPRLAALGCALIVCADDLPKWVLDLSRIQRGMSEELKKLPNYTCAENIERYVTEPAHKPRLIDRIQVNVAVVANRELYAWPGSGFQERSIAEK
jgi:hypothetical protein